MPKLNTIGWTSSLVINPESVLTISGVRATPHWAQRIRSVWSLGYKLCPGFIRWLSRNEPLVKFAVTTTHCASCHYCGGSTLACCEYASDSVAELDKRVREGAD
jgi:hypothetical protein